MTKYRKKPVVIEAIQYTGDNATEIANWTKQLSSERYIEDGGDYLLIQTLEGTMKAIPGDFIIKGIKNEFYPCKPDIFEQTYEKVEWEVAVPSINSSSEAEPEFQEVAIAYLNQQRGIE